MNLLLGWESLEIQENFQNELKRWNVQNRHNHHRPNIHYNAALENLNIQHNRAPLIKMTVWGSSLQIGCRLILLISEHPIQRGIRKECWHRIPGNGTEFLAKWRSLRKKVSLTPKKWKFGSKKKSLSPNPSGHGLFAKNCIKIGLVWPQQLHFWSTGAYRGSPPYAIFPLPDTKKYSIVLC